MEKFLVKFNDYEPKYIQICKHIKKLMEEHELKDNEKLPTIRKLSEFLGVNKGTVVNAYKKLENEGAAIQKMGSGTYIKFKDDGGVFRKKYSQIYKRISSGDMSKYIDFTGETTHSDFFPVNRFKEVLNEVIDRDGAEAFIFRETLGYYGLRKSISEFFWNNEIDSSDVLIVSGAQQGIDIIAKSIININDNVIVEKPTYMGALSVFKWRRANVLEVNLENDGVDVEEFEEILKKNNIKCYYTMTYFQNPSGISHSYEKKVKLLELAEKYDFYIIEDDYLSELIYDEIEYKTLKSLDKYDRVIYVKSFSKIFLPGIRLGYLLPPQKFKDNILKSKINTDISTSSLMQRALELYITKGYWKEHIDNIHDKYKSKYIFMKEALEAKLKNYVEIIYPGGGLTFYLKIKNSKLNSKELYKQALNRKVLIAPGVLFYKNNSDGNDYFRISFCKTDYGEIEKGINILREIFES